MMRRPHLAGEHGVPRDAGRAVKLLRRGVDMNDAESCFELGKLFEEGRGVVRSILDAEKLYRRCGWLVKTKGHINPNLCSKAHANTCQ